MFNNSMILNNKRLSAFISVIVSIFLLTAAIPLPGAPYPTPQPAVPQSNAATPSNSGPDEFPAGVNPLTGLPVENPALLELPPALVSVSNFPVSARPQAGLSFAPYVFEMYIGEGMTRYLALFYGVYPQADPAAAAKAGLAVDKAIIGPIRSGRLPYQTLSSLYNGFLVIASASAEVRTQLGASSNIYGSDDADINSALLDVTRLEAIAKANASNKDFNLTGNLYSASAPSSGKAAQKLWVFYNFYNQILWEYDSNSGAYLRSQDKADGSGNFHPSLDRLTGAPLAFENVVVFFVRHKALNGAKTLIDLEMDYTRNKAYLFRDGRVYPLYWSTLNGKYEKQTGLARPIRFQDAAGNPFPLKPGQTWVEIVDLSATLTEQTIGSWKARFYAP